MPKRMPTVREVAPVMPRISQEMKGLKGVMRETKKAKA